VRCLSLLRNGFCNSYKLFSALAGGIVGAVHRRFSFLDTLIVQHFLPLWTTWRSIFFLVSDTFRPLANSRRCPLLVRLFYPPFTSKKSFTEGRGVFFFLIFLSLFTGKGFFFLQGHACFSLNPVPSFPARGRPAPVLPRRTVHLLSHQSGHIFSFWINPFDLPFEERIPR